MSKRRDWLPVAREALAAYPEKVEFPASGLRTEIMEHLRPDIAALFGQDQTASPRTFTWLAAMKAWEAENPGLSDSSCRRLCDRLVAEGVLTMRREIRGWYVRDWYSKALAPAEADQ